MSFTMEWVGYLAALCTTIAFIPQVITTYKAKSAKGISLGMYTIFCTGVVSWLIYGFYLKSAALIAANACTLILTIAMIVMKIIFDQRDR